MQVIYWYCAWSVTPYSAKNKVISLILLSDFTFLAVYDQLQKLNLIQWNQQFIFCMKQLLGLIPMWTIKQGWAKKILKGTFEQKLMPHAHAEVSICWSVLDFLSSMNLDVNENEILCSGFNFA